MRETSPPRDLHQSVALRLQAQKVQDPEGGSQVRRGVASLALMRYGYVERRAPHGEEGVHRDPEAAVEVCPGHYPDVVAAEDPSDRPCRARTKEETHSGTAT